MVTHIICTINQPDLSRASSYPSAKGGFRLPPWWVAIVWSVCRYPYGGHGCICQLSQGHCLNWSSLTRVPKCFPCHRVESVCLASSVVGWSSHCRVAVFRLVPEGSHQCSRWCSRWASSPSGAGRSSVMIAVHVATWLRIDSPGVTRSPSFNGVASSCSWVLVSHKVKHMAHTRDHTHIWLLVTGWRQGAIVTNIITFLFESRYSQ